ncbi:MAG: hypothetical protein AB1657_03620 [Candidatus Micrarchaeota archaeon]
MPVSIFTDILQVKKPEKDLLESLLSAYESLAKARGFEVQRDGRMLTVKGERISAILRIEFGGRRDFFETITYMNSTPAEYKILIVSSNARSLPMEAAYTVLKKKLLVKEKWMLIDIEGKKPAMFINWSLPVPGSRLPVSSQRAGTEYRKPETGNRKRERGRPRRKIIYGSPEERKEQD